VPTRIQTDYGFDLVFAKGREWCTIDGVTDSALKRICLIPTTPKMIARIALFPDNGIPESDKYVRGYYIADDTSIECLLVPWGERPLAVHELTAILHRASGQIFVFTEVSFGEVAFDGVLRLPDLPGLWKKVSDECVKHLFVYELSLRVLPTTVVGVRNIYPFPSPE